MKFIACLLPIGLLMGCAASSEDDLVEPLKTPVAFEGKADSQYVATWKSEDGVSTYQLKEDGTYKLDSKIKVAQHAPIDSHLKGEWRVSDGRMLFKDERGDVVPYSIKLEGDTLKLRLTGKLASQTVLKRQ